MRFILLILLTSCALFCAEVPISMEANFPTTENPREFPYPPKVDNEGGPNFVVYDGDTIRLNILLWESQTKRISLRISGIDAPEIRPLKSRAAAEVTKKFVQHWIETRKEVPRTRIYKYSGKFGRPIGDLYTSQGTLSEWLLAQGVVVKYGEKDKFTGALLKEIAEKKVPEVRAEPDK